MELKTLKDLNFANLEPQRTQLRQSAIEDIKELEKPIEMDLKFAVIHGIRGFQKDFIERKWNESRKDIQSWIKWKFNITDKDLK